MKSIIICCLITIFVSILTKADQSELKQHSKLLQIEKNMQKILSPSINRRVQPQYTFYKIQHTVISIQNNIQLTADNIKVHNSVSIHDDETTIYPIIIEIGKQLYSIKGKKLVNFKDRQVYLSTARVEFTYFAQIKPNKQVEINKLYFINRKSQVQNEQVIQIAGQYGNITGFCNAFSLNKKLFAFATNKGYLLFYKNKQIVNQLHLEHNNNSAIKLLRLNNHIIAYSTHNIHLIHNSNPINNNIKQCVIPLLDSHGILNIKFDSINFKRFFVMTVDRIYLYQYQDRCSPIAVYPLPQYDIINQIVNFQVAGNMLIISLKGAKINYYYNTSDHSLHNLVLPKIKCNTTRKISMAAKSSQDHIICDFCLPDSQQNKNGLAFSCYILESSLSTTKLDYADYSKMRVPLIICSLGIIICIVASKNKNKGKKEVESVYQQLLNNVKSVNQQNSGKSRLQNGIKVPKDRNANLQSNNN